MAASPIGTKEQVQGAARSLEEVARRAWVWVSMPVVEGITPRALRESKAAEDVQTNEFLPRRQGNFRLDEIGLSTLDHVGLYGDGCFEGILVPSGQIFLYKEHLWRMWRSADQIRITIPYELEELAWQVLQTTRRVGYGQGETGYIRLVVTRGMGDLGINPAKCVGATAYSISSTIRLYPPDLYDRGIELGLARRIRRPDEHVLNPTVKSNNYLNNVMALLEGTRGGELLECLVMTPNGFIAEATVDNIFSIVREPGWEKDPGKVSVFTPRGAYCLNGITRALVMHIAREQGYRIDCEADLVPMDLVGPERECFMTGTGAGIMPIIRVDGRAVGDGTPGPVSKGLITKVKAAMANPGFGLPLGATRDQLREYLATPSPVKGIPVEGGPAAARPAPARV